MHSPCPMLFRDALLLRLHLPLRLAILSCVCSTPFALTRDHQDMSRTAILLNQIDDLRCALA